MTEIARCRADREAAVGNGAHTEYYGTEDDALVCFAHKFSLDRARSTSCIRLSSTNFNLPACGGVSSLARQPNGVLLMSRMQSKSGGDIGERATHREFLSFDLVQGTWFAV